MKVTNDTLDTRLDSLELPPREASVVDRIRYLIVLMRKTQAQFGKLIDVDPSNMSKILSGRLRVTDGMLNRIVVNLGVDKNWLANGTDVPFPRKPQLPATNGVAQHHSNSVAVEKKGAPVYDIDVTAGSMELNRMFTVDRIIGYLNMPALNSNHPLVRVSGDSMSPRISHGSYIQIRPVSEDGPIFWGSIYVVVTEDYRMVKIVRKHPERNKVILHSINPEYDDMEMDRLDIRRLYFVEAIFNYDVLA